MYIYTHTREKKRFIRDLALFVAAALHLYTSVFCTQCLSLTLVLWTDPSNSIFSSSCLSSIPFLSALFSLSLLSFPHLFCFCFFFCFPSSHPASFICFMIYHLLHDTHVTSSLPVPSLVSPRPPPPSPPIHLQRHRRLGPSQPAWQGTDLMHNHVLADVDQSCVDSPGRRSSVSRPELTSDLSEDSDYDSIWTTHSYRMGSVPRKSCISHQNWRPYSTATLYCKVKYSLLTSFLFSVLKKIIDFF